MLDLMLMWTGWLEGELYLLGADPAALEICRELRQAIMDQAATSPGPHVAISPDSRHVQ